MARILVNYIHNKKDDSFELQNGRYVLADMPVAILETEDIIDEALIVPIKGNPTVVDKKRYESINKKFKLAVDKDGKVYEDEKGTDIWLPKDTDVSKLIIKDGVLTLVEDNGDK